MNGATVVQVGHGEAVPEGVGITRSLYASLFAASAQQRGQTVASEMFSASIDEHTIGVCLTAHSQPRGCGLLGVEPKGDATVFSSLPITGSLPNLC